VLTATTLKCRGPHCPRDPFPAGGPRGPSGVAGRAGLCPSTGIHGNASMVTSNGTHCGNNSMIVANSDTNQLFMGNEASTTRIVGQVDLVSLSLAPVNVNTSVVIDPHTGEVLLGSDPASRCPPTDTLTGNLTMLVTDGQTCGQTNLVSVRQSSLELASPSVTTNVNSAIVNFNN